MKRFETLTQETQTALLFLWLSAFCTGGFGVALSWQALSFLIFAFASFAIVSFLTALQFFAQARISQYSPDNEIGEENEIGEDEITEKQVSDNQNISPSPGYLPPDEEALRERAKFYRFVFGVTRQGIKGEIAWEKQGLSRKTYRNWISRLETVGIVRPPREGAPREVKMNLEEALEAIARASGEPDYWQPVLSSFNTPPPFSIRTAAQPPQPQPSTYSHQLRLSQFSREVE